MSPCRGEVHPGLRRSPGEPRADGLPVAGADAGPVSAAAVHWEETVRRLFAPLIMLAPFALAAPASAAQVAILMPGSAGIVPGDFLVRNEARFKAAGLRTVLTTSPAEAAATVATAASQGQ